MDMWLDIATAVGTIGAVIVSLFLSGKETRNRKKQEEENAKKAKHIIELSVSNIVEKMGRYSDIIEKAMIEFPDEVNQQYHEIGRTNQKSIVISTSAYNVVTKEVNIYKNRDYEYVVSQVEVLRKLDLNVLPTGLIAYYHSSYTAAAILEQWLLRINNLNPMTNSLIAYLDYYLSPLIKILNDEE